MERIEIGLIGFGTVGKSFYELLRKRKNRLREQLGVELVVSKIGVRDPEKHGKRIDGSLFVEGYNEILEDENINIVVELVGGIEIPFEIIRQALSGGKHVITANKALLAQHGKELFMLARESGVELKFEASVGGGIPVIKVIRESLKGNEIFAISGILNGTTNYILTRMTEAGLSFQDALKEAQEKGFAESDPTLDIEGIDAAQKISLLSSLAFDGWVDYRDILCEGIKKITKKDIDFAALAGFVFKLVATGRMIGDRPLVAVFPALLPKGHPLATVRNEYNAVLIESDFLGKSMYLGKGAGGDATASSVASDLGDLIERIRMKAKPDPVKPRPSRPFSLFPREDMSFKYYFHFVTENRPGIWATVTGLLATNEINIESVHQKWENPAEPSDLYVMVDETAESKVVKAFEEIINAGGIHDTSTYFRILED